VSQRGGAKGGNRDMAMAEIPMRPCHVPKRKEAEGDDDGNLPRKQRRCSPLDGVPNFIMITSMMTV
jgi:hypothetical protein